MTSHEDALRGLLTGWIAASIARPELLSIRIVTWEVGRLVVEWEDRRLVITVEVQGDDPSRGPW